MIIWVASYPRSGNSLTRQVLRQCFGRESYVLRRPNTGSAISHIIGGGKFDGSDDELLATARAGDKPWFIKTHYESDVADHEKCLYPFRDARAALYSFCQFRKEVASTDTPLERLIRQPAWSTHVEWALSRPPENTLLLPFEELKEVTPSILTRISAFTGLPILNTTIQPFSEIQKNRPYHTKIGHNQVGIEEVERQYSDLFWGRHGEMMRRLGYSKTGVGDPVNA